MKRKTRYAVVVGTVVLAAAMIPATSTQSEAVTRVAVDAALDCYGCASCFHPDISVPAVSPFPDTWWITWGTYYCPQNPFYEPCGWGGCEEPAAVAMVQELQLLVAGAAIHKIEHFLELNQRYAVLVPERQAVQVLGCADGVIYGQVELGDEILNGLVAHTR